MHIDIFMRFPDFFPLDGFRLAYSGDSPADGFDPIAARV
jgi:hypothetical protein